MRRQPPVSQRSSTSSATYSPQVSVTSGPPSPGYRHKTTDWPRSPARPSPKKRTKHRSKALSGVPHSSIPVLLPPQVVIEPQHNTMKTVLEGLGFSKPTPVVRETGTVLKYVHPTHAKGSFVTNPAAVTMISQLPGEFSILMVVGPADGQKSNLLSFILEACGVPGPRHFLGANEGMAGLWVWPQLIMFRDRPFLVLDCECCDPTVVDPMRPHIESLFSLSCVLSSIVIYTTPGHPLTAERMEKLDSVSSVLGRNIQSLTNVLGNAAEAQRPFMMYCLRDWPGDIPIDPAHPPMVESADGGPPKVLTGTQQGQTMFCSLPPCKTEGAAPKTKRVVRKAHSGPSSPHRGVRPPSPSPSYTHSGNVSVSTAGRSGPNSPGRSPSRQGHSSPGHGKPKTKSKAKKAKGYSAMDCDQQFVQGLRSFLRTIYDSTRPLPYDGPTFVSRMASILTASHMVADGKGLEADVARLVKKYTVEVRQGFTQLRKEIPIPTPSLREKIQAILAKAGADMWKEILALERSSSPQMMKNAQESAEYLANLMGPDVVNLVTENEMAYDGEINKLVDRLVEERMADLNAITSREVALKVWPSQIPPSLEPVKATVEARVAAKMAEELQHFEKKVGESLQSVLWRLAAPFFELPTSRPLSPTSIPDLTKGLAPLETAYRHHLNTLLFPSVGATFELRQAAEAGPDAPSGPLPKVRDLIAEYEERTAAIPRFLVLNISQIIPMVKQQLAAICLSYSHREVARVYTNVLRELLLPMGLADTPYEEAWVDLPLQPPIAPRSDVPPELKSQLQKLVHNGPVVVNRDALVLRWEEHQRNVLQLTVPALAQLFTDNVPCSSLQYALQQELAALIKGCVATVITTLPELCQQVVVEFEDATPLPALEVARRIEATAGVKASYATKAPEGEGTLLTFDSELSAVKVLRYEKYPAEWGFRPQPLQLPRIMLAGIPSNADERAVRDLISMYCGVELRGVALKTPNAELVPVHNSDVDALLNIGNVRLLGTRCELQEFETFDLAIPGEGQSDVRFPTKHTLEAALGVDIAFVEGVDDKTVRVGLWTAMNKPAAIETAIKKGFEVPKMQSRPSTQTFLGQFSNTEPVSVNCPIDQYKDLTWDPVEYKMQVGDLVDRIRRQVPADKLAAALHKDPNLRNFRRIAMLATMAACENRYYFAGSERVEIGPISAMDTTNYADVLPPLQRPRHRSTKVTIEDTDMMELAGFLAHSGQKVLMLNMANPTEPGGGWMAGTAAQEEDLFRRSDYHLGITPFGAAGKNAQYPIPVFGAIMTENVTVFRGDEQDGYCFLPKPYVVSIIAVAAFNCHNYIPPSQSGAANSARAPATAKLPDGRIVLTDEVCVYTRRKLETLFRAAIDKGYDVLVLSALGCGAFGNPPLSMANIFHEVLTEYGGQVKEIHFAIKNEAICDTFMGILRQEYTADVGGQYEHLNFTKPLPVCPLGGKCLDLAHQQAAYHVPLCARSRGCNMAQPGYGLHKILTAHLQDCPQQALCTLIDDTVHCRYFDHPTQHCVLQGECQNMELSHLRAHRHVPTCELGGPEKCPQYNDKSHRMQRRHPLQPCPMQGQCYSHLSDTHHLTVFSHPFVNPCPNTPNCKDHTQAHRKHFAHVCPVGASCTQMQDSKHSRHHIHFPPHSCPDAGCVNMSEDHLNTYSHPGILDIRPPCAEGEQCKDQAEDYHIKQYSHPDVPRELCKVLPVFADQTKGAEVDFAANVRMLKNAVLSWMGRQGIRPPVVDSPRFQRIVEFFRNSRPVHRCSFDKVQNMVRSGAVLSLHCVETLLSNVNQMVDLVLTHPLVVPVCQTYLEHRNSLRDLVKNKLMLTLHKSNATGESDPSKAKYYEDTLRNDFGSLIVAMGDSIPLLDSVIQGMVQSALDVRKTGIGFQRDRTIGTDQSIFAVQGINIAGSYGRIRLIFHPDIMHHPNFYITPFAAVFFVDDSESPARYAFNRPWVDNGVSKPWASGGRQRFLQHQLHPSVPECYEALALDFVARVVSLKGLRDASTVDWDQVMEYWHRYTHNPSTVTPDEQRELESCHWAPEAHCPYSMPLSYVEHVVMSEETYRETFTPEMQAALRRTFTSIHIERDEQAAHEKSVQLATAPHRSRRGYCFSLVADVNETYLPIIAPSTQPLHIYFKAKGAFAIVFSSELSDQSAHRQAFTITVVKGEVVIYEGSTLTPLSKRRVLAQVSGFNDRLDSTDFIFYYCAVDPARNQVLLDHWGPSELHSSTKGLTITSNVPLPRDLRYISFKALEPLTAFHDIFTLSNRLPPVKDPQIPCRPACPDGCNCPLAYYTASENPLHITHTAQYLHPCLWGEQCIDSNPTHQSQFSHQRAPLGVCPQGPNCSRREDYRHRQQYSHVGLWAFMLLCKHASRSQCREAAKDPSHCVKYYHQEDAPERHVTFSTMYQVIDVDDENVEQSIYNMAVAGKTAFGADVERDAFGVALGSDYDLATPGSRKGWNVLVGNFGQRHELTESDLEKCAFVSLRSLGFSIEYTESEKAFTKALNRGPKSSWPKPTHHLAGIPRNQELIKQWHVLWIVSGPQMRDQDANEKSFVEAIIKCHLKGNGILLWAENEPFFYHANLVLPHLQQSRVAPHIRLTGNTCGKGCILNPGSATAKSQYGSHFITTGVERLYEGNTICYPTTTAGFTVLGTSSAGNPVLLYGDAQYGPGVQYCGRVVIDNGWTKLVPALWATAGTPRYISNSTSWLAFLERLSRKYRMPITEDFVSTSPPLAHPPAVIAPSASMSSQNLAVPSGSTWTPYYASQSSNSGFSASGSSQRSESHDDEEDEEDEEEEWDEEEEETA